MPRIRARTATTWASCRFGSTHSWAVFYRTPFRVFELAIGAGLVWSAPYRPRPAGLLDEFGLVAGLALIVLSVLGKLRVSEVAGLVPSLGTALVIQCGTTQHAGRISWRASPLTSYCVAHPEYALRAPL